MWLVKGRVTHQLMVGCGDMRRAASSCTANRIFSLIALGCSLMAAHGCTRLRDWRGHTLLVEYFWTASRGTQVTRLTDTRSGATVDNRQLFKAITEEANRDLPQWIQMEKLTRASGAFHARILQDGSIEIVEASHGVEGAPSEFVKDPDVTAEMMAAHQGKLGELKTLIDAGGPVNAKDQRGDTALAGCGNFAPR